MDRYFWHPIEDLPGNYGEMASQELEKLASIWIEQAGKLQESEALRRFNEKLRRQWAIETGIIENLYSIDRGVTLLLIEKGIESSLIPHGSADKPADLIVSIIRDQEEALEGLFDFVSGKRELSTSYIKQLHQVFTEHQACSAAVTPQGEMIQVCLARGEWKKLPNNPTRPDGEMHEYCPPEQVSSEMDCLIEMHKTHIAEEIPPEVEAAWLHHRFAQIHPFQDGNGRIARALASLIFIRKRWFPLVIDRDTRGEYIEALENADKGDLQTLINLFVSIQKKSFIKALSISEDVLKFHRTLRQVIGAATDRLKARSEYRERERQRVFDVAYSLENIAQERFRSVAETLNVELHDISNNYVVFAERSGTGNDYWFKTQIVNIAKSSDYYADTRTYRAWVRLKIREERQIELVISFHALGVEFLGIMAASAFLIYRDPNENDAMAVDGPYQIHKEAFHFSYTEDQDLVENRFRIWIDEVVLFGLDEWRRQI